ncbi:MAG: hypothetical protein ABIQ04_04640 [Candidatus Saccharimonadales bacterium]
MLRLLRLQHHKHTGKVLTHRHTSYRSLFLVVAFFCVTLAGIQKAAGADEIVISAKIAARVSTQPAVITSVADGSTTTTPIITLTGTCEVIDPPILISIYSGATFLGSTQCGADGTFSVSVVLQPGGNTLIARSVNRTGDYGPDSAPITVTYIEPVSGTVAGTADGITLPKNSSQNTITTNDGIAPIQILSKYTYLTYGPNKDAEWAGTFTGGRQPYVVTIDWGDNHTTEQRNVKGDEFSMNHHYDHYVTYFITLTVTDIDGRTLSRQFAAVTPYIPPTSTTTTTTDLPLLDEHTLTAGIYASLTVLAGLAAIVWFEAAHSVPVLIAGAHGSGRVPRNIKKRSVRKR